MGGLLRESGVVRVVSRKGSRALLGRKRGRHSPPGNGCWCVRGIASPQALDPVDARVRNGPHRVRHKNGASIARREMDYQELNRKDTGYKTGVFRR